MNPFPFILAIFLALGLGSGAFYLWDAPSWAAHMFGFAYFTWALPIITKIFRR